MFEDQIGMDGRFVVSPDGRYALRGAWRGDGQFVLEYQWLGEPSRGWFQVTFEGGTATVHVRDSATGENVMVVAERDG